MRSPPSITGTCIAPHLGAGVHCQQNLELTGMLNYIIIY
jgi:hypothetical protein